MKSFYYQGEEGIFLVCSISQPTEHRVLTLEFRDDEYYWRREIRPDPSGRFVCVLPDGYNFLFGSSILFLADHTVVLPAPYRYPEPLCSDAHHAARWLAQRRADGVTPAMLAALITCLQRMALPCSAVQKVLETEMRSLTNATYYPCS